MDLPISTPMFYFSHWDVEIEEIVYDYWFLKRLQRNKYQSMIFISSTAACMKTLVTKIYHHGIMHEYKCWYSSRMHVFPWYLEVFYNLTSALHSSLCQSRRLWEFDRQHFILLYSLKRKVLPCENTEDALTSHNPDTICTDTPCVDVIWLGLRPDSTTHTI
jgi:hypothetical protein